jgi:hypothetical protein
MIFENMMTINEGGQNKQGRCNEYTLYLDMNI